jgi:5'-methylthioadenosine phosphorylase
MSMKASKNIGIIGGSGVYNIEGIKTIKEHIVETPYGKPSDAILEGEIEGVRFFFLARHGRAHSVLPHEINYRANIFALKKLGVEYLISISAVGSLQEACPPTSFVLPDQFVDWTKGKRERSFFGQGIVAHVSTAYPIEKKLQSMIFESCKKNKIQTKLGGTYLCIEGPQFSSRAESEIYRSFKATVIGMTNVPESYLAKEAAMAYATIAMVTDYDCWKEEACSVDEIMKVAHENTKKVAAVIKEVVPQLSKNKFEFEKINKVGLMTPLEKLNSDQKAILEVLFL